MCRCDRRGNGHRRRRVFDLMRHARDRRRRAIAKPHRRADDHAQRLRRRLRMQCVGIRIHSFRKLQPEHIQPLRLQARHQFRRRALARLIAIKRDQHPPAAAVLERRQQLVGDSIHPKRTGDVLKPRRDKRQRIDQRLAQNHFLRALDPAAVEHAPMRPRQIQMQRRARAQTLRHLAPVHLHHMPRRIEHRNHQRAVEMLVARRAQNPDPLQLSPRRCAGDRGLGWQAIAQRPVRKP